MRRAIDGPHQRRLENPETTKGSVEMQPTHRAALMNENMGVSTAAFLSELETDEIPELHRGEFVLLPLAVNGRSSAKPLESLRDLGREILEPGSLQGRVTRGPAAPGRRDRDEPRPKPCIAGPLRLADRSRSPQPLPMLTARQALPAAHIGLPENRGPRVGNPGQEPHRRVGPMLQLEQHRRGTALARLTGGEVPVSNPTPVAPIQPSPGHGWPAR